MELEIIKVLDIFLPFRMTFNATIAHNMCVLQINPHFKGLQYGMDM
jgi:hypothetical protein